MQHQKKPAPQRAFLMLHMPPIFANFAVEIPRDKKSNASASTLFGDEHTFNSIKPLKDESK
jgi:hypothetical protein